MLVTSLTLVRTLSELSSFGVCGVGCVGVFYCSNVDFLSFSLAGVYGARSCYHSPVVSVYHPQILGCFRVVYFSLLQNVSKNLLELP